MPCMAKLNELTVSLFLQFDKIDSFLEIADLLSAEDRATVKAFLSGKAI